MQIFAQKTGEKYAGIFQEKRNFWYYINLYGQPVILVQPYVTKFDFMLVSCFLNISQGRLSK